MRFARRAAPVASALGVARLARTRYGEQTVAVGRGKRRAFSTRIVSDGDTATTIRVRRLNRRFL